MSKKKQKKQGKAKPTATRKCAVCGKAFKTDVANKQYCSPKCYMAAKLARRKGKAKAKSAPKKPVAAVKKAVVVKRVESPLTMMSLAFRIMADALRIVAERAASHDGCTCGKKCKK